jgi:outer membrane protein TolC
MEDSMMRVRPIYGWLLFPLLALSAHAQQLSGGATSPSLPQSLDQLLSSANENPFTGSVSSAAPQPGVLDLKVEDAIDRALKANLGIIVSTQSTAQARAARLNELSKLLPQINGNLRESYNRTNLQALGINIPIAGVPKAVEFTNSDARVSMTENLIDLHQLGNLRASTANVRAAGFDYSSARETVTLAAVGSYLLVRSAESQVEAVTAELRTAEALQQLAIDRESAGLSPNIDTLRARVELQVRRQNLIEANKNLAKQRITLLRVLGLPVQQQFRLATNIPYKPLPPIAQAGLLQQALAQRPDYLAAEQRVKAAELRTKAARAERLPSVGVNGDYGVLGTAPNNAIPTWTISGGVRVPVFQGGKIESDIQTEEANLRQATARRDDLRGRVEQEIADALLDISAAAEQLQVAQATLDYARLALTQAQDRFAAGVTNNIEVIQAQEALATADQQYISSVYSHDIARVLLARALGAAERSVREVLAQEAGSQTETNPGAPGPAIPNPPTPAPAAPSAAPGAAPAK